MPSGLFGHLAKIGGSAEEALDSGHVLQWGRQRPWVSGFLTLAREVARVTDFGQLSVDASPRNAWPCSASFATPVQFVDALKSRLVPAHLRPPLGALNWIPPTGDSEVDGQMVARMEQALGVVQDVLEVLRTKIAEQGAEVLVSPFGSRSSLVGGG